MNVASESRVFAMLDEDGGWEETPAAEHARNLARDEHKLMDHNELRPLQWPTTNSRDAASFAQAMKEWR